MQTIMPWWPTKPCTRCGGSGRYSYNAMDGDRCYGCGGNGRMFRNDGVAEVALEWRANAKHAKEAVAGVDGLDPRSTLQVGDKVWANDEHTAYRIERGDKDKGYGWREVIAIERTDEACGWKVVNDERIPTHWRTNITLDNGAVIRVDGTLIRRQYIIDQTTATEYQRRAIKALPRNEWLAALLATTHHYARQSVA